MSLPIRGIIPDILDNSSEERSLSRVLSLILLPDCNVRIASGYFNLGGYARVSGGLDQARTLQLLLGREPSQTTEVTRTGRAIPLLERLREDTEQTLDRRETNSVIAAFQELVRRGTTEVRLYTKGFFHGKAYIVQGHPHFDSIAISGSSNFTFAGLTSNAELNTVHKQEATVRDLLAWFERHWNEADDFKEEILALLEDFTKPYEPYLIYMKVLYEYLKDRLDVDVPQAALPSAIHLADFQHDGYMAARDILNRYNGVLIADSVGTGKTFLGLKILEDFAYFQRMKALVVCPAQLRDILWAKELRRVSVHADIVSQEELGRAEFEIEKYLDSEVIVVDESHNFRNSATNRYEALMRLLTHQASKVKYVVLLTATPVNNTLFDLYNQIRLITKDRDDYFAAAGIPSLWGYFVKALKENGQLFDLLEEISVRRSRSFIREYYKGALIDGKPIHFPRRRLHQESYSLESTYQGFYDEVAHTVQDLRLAAQNLEDYRKGIAVQLSLVDTMVDDLAKQGWDRIEAEEYVRKLSGGRALTYILKTLYLKRLESSIPALRISLERQASFQQRFLENLKAGRLLDAASFRRIYLPEGSDDVSEEEREGEIEELLAKLEEVDASKYNLRAIEKDVVRDIESLGKVLINLRELERSEKDDKLIALGDLLVRLKNRKVIVFSYFKDTARYLYRQLRSPEFLSRLGRAEGQVSIVDSGVEPKERMDRIQRFAPTANDAPQLKGSPREIHVLLSTDVLSEGQNLQDSDTVVNYDLHWNPVRMIQRAGRIDRLGSDFETVHVHNFLPEDRLESLLGLVSKLQEKLSDINRAVGLDAPVMGEAVNPRDFNALRRIMAGDESALTELEKMSELEVGEFLLQDIKEYLLRTGKSTLEAIPDGVGSGLSKSGYRGLFAHLRGGDRHFWAYYDMKTDKISLSRLDSLRAIRCHPNQARVNPDFEPLDIIPKIKHHIANEVKKAKVRLPRIPAPQSQIVNYLRGMPSQPSTSQLVAYFSFPLPKYVLRELRNLWREIGSMPPASVVQSLQRFEEANPVREEASPETALDLNEEDLRLVAFLSLV